MENVSENEKKTLKQKFLEFQKSGLVSYGKHLTEQHEFASKSNSRSAYKKYIEEQIEMNNRKIEEIDEKLE
jgi:hypothetical protein